MVLIALESSTRSPSVAALVDGNLLESVINGDRPHASDLLPCLSQLLDSCGQSAEDITAVAVGIGPGSYTGLRVGIATAQGVARAARAELIGIPSGEALAFAELSPGEQGDLLIDARGGALYHARFERTTDGVVTLIPPRIVPAESFQELLEEATVVFLDEALKSSDASFGTQRVIVGRAPKACSLLELARPRLEEGCATSLSSVLPLYLRPFEGRVRKR